MAEKPQILSLNEAWSGLWTGGSTPRDFMEKDDLGKLAWITRDRTGFNNFIHTRFGKSRKVKDRIFRTQEIHDFERYYTVKASSQDGLHNTFGIDNEQAAQLQANDMLYNTNIFYKPTGESLQLGQVNDDNVVPTNPTPSALKQSQGLNVNSIIYSRTKGVINNNYVYDIEPMRIINIGANDSAGNGLTLVTVERTVSGPGARDRTGGRIEKSVVNASIANDTDNAAILVGDRLIKGLPSWKEGTGAPHGYGKTPKIDINFSQEFKFALEKTTESDIRQKASKMMDPLTIQRKLKAMDITRMMEATYIFGKKGYETDRNGKQTFYTGGVFEWIPKDADHVIGMPGNLTYSLILDTMYKIDQIGGSKEKELFLPPFQYNRIKKAFYNSEHMIYDVDKSKEFDVPVYSLVGSTSKLNLHPLYVLEDFNMFDIGLVLDMNYDSFVPVTHEGWDMKVKTNIQDPADEIYKESITGIKGLERRYADYHAIIQF